MNTKIFLLFVLLSSLFYVSSSSSQLQQNPLQSVTCFDIGLTCLNNCCCILNDTRQIECTKTPISNALCTCKIIYIAWYIWLIIGIGALIVIALIAFIIFKKCKARRGYNERLLVD